MSTESCKTKLSFKDYYDSTRKLKEASDSLKYYVTYEITKYCKIPLVEEHGDDTKNHVSLKPSDRIRVLWESNGPDDKIPKLVTLETDTAGTRYNFVWNPIKVSDWLVATTYER